jgi:isopentenyl phosphate kinase
MADDFDRSPLTVVKLGGSLITDKTTPFAARDDVIQRLAQEVASGWASSDGGLLLGHGSGSFGHVAAERTGLLDETPSVPPAEALSRVQQAAAALHRHVTEALRSAGVPVFSVAPSSAMVASDGTPVAVQGEPVRRALSADAVPVTYGDVVLDRTRGATICSTETVLRAFIDALRDDGVSVRRVLWMGDTDGVYDAEGQTIDRLPPEDVQDTLEAVDVPRGTDVTGGMRHRLDAACALAERGIPSVIANGTAPGALERALAGASIPGTRVPAAS